MYPATSAKILLKRERSKDYVACNHFSHVIKFINICKKWNWIRKDIQAFTPWNMRTSIWNLHEEWEEIILQGKRIIISAADDLNTTAEPAVSRSS